jgi:O-antigen/teichoic acid export membrane protein
VLNGSGPITAAIAIMNLSTYGFTIVAARVLGPGTYGAVASLMATLMVIGVLQLSLQATAARRISANPQHVAEIERTVLGVTYRAALILGGVLLALSPLVNQLLRLDSLPAAALVAAAAVPMAMMGGQAGVLQGERRWRPLAVMYVANGIPRLVVGTALILWHPSETSAMVGVVLGAVPPVLLGWWFLREQRALGAGAEAHGFRLVAREIVHNSHALFAFFVLSNADVVVARNVLPEHTAGLYAAGLILTKAVLFLPQFVIVLAFPGLSEGGRTRARYRVRSLTLVAALGGLVIGGVWVLSDLAVAFIGGPKYSSIAGYLPGFALLGCLLSLIQILVYDLVAQQGRASIAALWVALVTIASSALVVDGVRELLEWVVVVDLALLLVLVVPRRAVRALMPGGR